MDEQGPAAKPMGMAIKCSSCRGGACELKPAAASPFALDTVASPSDSPPTESGGGRWVWFPQPFNRNYSTTSFLTARSRASTHFCDLDDISDGDTDDESVATDEEIALTAADVSRVQSRRSNAPAKPVRAAAGHSRLSVILLDQGLFTVYKRLFMLCIALNAAGLAAAATGRPSNTCCGCCGLNTAPRLAP